MKPFYQGKIDTFCAIYAVLNSLRITHGIRTLRARELFNETLMSLIKKPQDFLAVLEQTTDYVQLVDQMFSDIKARIPLRVEKPFRQDEYVSLEKFWQVCLQWVNSDKNRTAVFRFIRYFDVNKPPVVRHWTTIESINSMNIRLYDSSHEAESIQNLRKDMVVVEEKNITKDVLIYIQPSTLRLVCLPF